MPLLDHFHSPLASRRHWESFHVNWASAVADVLNESLLPQGYFAEEHVDTGAAVEIDVATFEESTPASSASAGGPIATLPTKVWSPGAPTIVIPATFPDAFEVLVFENEGGARLVAAIEIVSPSNKDRNAHRRAFAIKCASYLCQGVSLIVVGIVTSRQANLHNEMMRLTGQEDALMRSADETLYAIAYRPVLRDQQEQIEAWPVALAVGEPLPTLPLFLNAELALPLDLEATYTAACQRRRLG